MRCFGCNHLFLRQLHDVAWHSPCPGVLWVVSRLRAYSWERCASISDECFIAPPSLNYNPHDFHSQKISESGLKGGGGPFLKYMSPSHLNLSLGVLPLRQVQTKLCDIFRQFHNLFDNIFQRFDSFSKFRQRSQDVLTISFLLCECIAQLLPLMVDRIQISCNDKYTDFLKSFKERNRKNGG